MDADRELELHRLSRVLYVIMARKFWHGFEFRIFYGREATRADWDEFWGVE